MDLSFGGKAVVESSGIRGSGIGEENRRGNGGKPRRIRCSRIARTYFWRKIVRASVMDDVAFTW